MKNNIRKIVCFALTLTLLTGVLIPSPAEGKVKAAVSCKSLCGAALKATGNSKKLKYTSVSALDFGGLSASARSKVKKIQYVCDAKEVYSLCVIETAGSPHAKAIVNALKKYKKNNNNSKYLSDYSKTERKVFKNAVCGRKGRFVWYISMSPKKAVNNKGQAAIKKKI